MVRKAEEMQTCSRVGLQNDTVLISGHAEDFLLTLDFANRSSVFPPPLMVHHPVEHGGHLCRERRTQVPSGGKKHPTSSVLSLCVQDDHRLLQVAVLRTDTFISKTATEKCPSIEKKWTLLAQKEELVAGLPSRSISCLT